MNKIYPKTILIVCEGEGTEPNYFQKYKDILVSKGLNIVLEIKPRPKKEPLEEEFIVREGGKKRQFKNPDLALPKSEIEEEFKAQPTRYVREAQLGLEDGLYDEVWAVFDKDGHPKHEEAFNLAEKDFEGKKVNIAFNSIAFEFWILLHFESNTSAFTKSMCRDGKEYFFCGKKISSNDCSGALCVCGHLVGQNYLIYENDSKSFSFSKYSNNVQQAIVRAVNLKKGYSKNVSPLYDLNPYTDTYRLVYKLLHFDKYDLIWYNFNERQIIEIIEIEIAQNNSLLSIHVHKLSPRAFMINPDLFCLFDVNGLKLEVAQRQVMYGDDYQIDIDLNAIKDFFPIFFGIKKTSNQYLITEL